MAVSSPSRLDPRPLLALLADGRQRSSAWLSRQLHQSETAVHQGVEELRARGLEVLTPASDAYRLSHPVETLDASCIRTALGEERAQRLRVFEVLFEVDSTNSRLLSAAAPPAGCADVCLSEWQHAGRGRRGRRWIAPFGAGISMSVSWTFGGGARSLPGLSLGAGVAIARALARAGAVGVGLKWPNDIVLDDRKIGGVLIELRADAGGPAHVVLGVGINVALPAAARRELEAAGARVAAVADACALPPSRNFVAGAILDEVLSMLVDFEREGFAGFRDAWSSLDAMKGRPARVLNGEAVVSGIARGVDDEGALLLVNGDGIRRFVSGEVSLRLIEGDA